MKPVFLLILVCLILSNSCSKFGCPASTDDPVVPCPYQDPVWYPDGTLLGFNHQAVQSIGYDKCDEKSFCSFYPDSSGFWLVNRDGTSMRMVTTFSLSTPAWSPDGKWIAFSNGGVIYKMPFDGAHFDTTHVIALTDNLFNHFYPSWSPGGDTIYYDSNKDAPEHTDFYFIWKMAADGSGQTRITDTAVGVTNGGARQPFCTPANQILNFRYRLESQQWQVFIMDANGNNVKQITHISDDSYYRGIGYFNNRVFYEDNNTMWGCNMDGSDVQKIADSSPYGFSIAKDGTVAYIKFDGNKLDQTHGTVWLTDVNVNNSKPFTYNNY